MIMWFDEMKTEASAGNDVVDWRFSGTSELDSAFVQFVSKQKASSGAQYWVRGDHSCCMYLASL